MTDCCIDCSAHLVVPGDAVSGEIVSCPDCGLDYVVEVDEKGNKDLKQLAVEGEDWGE